MHCEKMAVTDMPFGQRVVIEFLLKEGNSAEVTYKRLHDTYGEACTGTSSVRRWVKHFKDGNTDIADQPRCGRPITAATESNKQKVDELRQNRSITVREIAVQLGVGNHAVQDMMEILGYRTVCSRWVPRLLTEEHKTAGNCSPIHPTFRMAPSDYHLFGPLKDHLRGHHYETDRQSRKSFKAGCEELERTFTAEAFF
jgi:transposase